MGLKFGLIFFTKQERQGNNMNTWQTPDFKEIKFSNTEYGGDIAGEPDDIFVNAFGNWEATFVYDAGADAGPDEMES